MDKSLRSDYIFRRKREREVFIRQRLKRFLWVSRLDCTHGIDWYRHMHRPEITSLIKEARKYLIYSPSTDDYSIWLVLFYNFHKIWLKPLKQSK